METPQGIDVADPASSCDKRHAFALRFEIPDGVFERRLGHRIAADRLKIWGHSPPCSALAVPAWAPAR